MTWRGIMTRCYSPNDKDYKYYGARGIKVCPEWRNLRTFIEDIEEAIGPRPPGMTLDRIDNNGDYGPGNVRWATRSRQIANSRTRGGTSQYRGVSYVGKSHKWRADVWKDYEQHYLGQYADEIEAALARDRKAHELWGDDAILNFPGEVA